MKLLVALTLASGLFVTDALAKDVYVHGYTRKDGTYVAPYVRSSPNSTKADNYGPKQGGSTYGGYSPYGLLGAAPRARDADRDGLPNFRDRDDNNNTVHDDRDRYQYRQGNSFGR